MSPRGAAAAAARPPCVATPGLQVSNHDIELEVSLDPPAIGGKGSVRLKATAPTAVIALDTSELVVSRVLVGSLPLSFESTPSRVCVTLAEPLAAGSELTLQLEWQASTSQYTPKFSKDDVWAGYQTSAWMPTLQDAAQRATLSLRIVADAALKVSASGREAGHQALADGRVRHSFALDRPTAPFLYAFAAGRFEAAELRVDEMRLRAFGPPGADLKGALHATGAMYRFLNGKLGVPHPWREYVQVFVRTDVAQEAAGMALIGAQSLADRRADPEDDWIFIHELSHQWFGWMVPCADFADFWLNEGFATFMVGAFKEARWGAAAYQRELGNWRQRSAKAHAEGKDAPVALSSPTGEARVAPRDDQLQSRGVTYFRGALVLHRLRTELGEEVFWRGIRGYVTSLAGKSARTIDLRRALETASGRDLSPFFERWVYSVAIEP
jgi:aminopeptidase N